MHVISSYCEYEELSDNTIQKSDADVFLNAESIDSPPVVTSENVKHSASDNTSVQQSDTNNNSGNGKMMLYSLADIIIVLHFPHILTLFMIYDTFILPGVRLCNPSSYVGALL